MFKANQIIEAIQALGYGKDLNTGLNRWLRTMTGRVGSTNTLWFNYLRGLGYTGSLNTMLAAYYAASNGAAITNPIPSLFRNNEKGVWYDPSDFSTLFQDSAGTTPVTAVGDPVGLVLDKSQGLVLGSDVMTLANAVEDDSNATTGWTSFADIFESQSTVTNGSNYAFRVHSNTVPTAAARISRNLTGLTVGQTYKITLDIRHVGTGGAWGVFVGGTDSATTLSVGSVFNTDTTFRTLSAYFTFGVDYDFIVIREASATNDGGVYVDNVHVQLVPGYHATQATSTARPILARHPISGRRNLLTYTEDFSNAVWAKTNTTITANAAVSPDGTTTADLVVLGTVADDRITYAVPVGLGSTYTLSFYARSISGTVSWEYRVWKGASYSATQTALLTTEWQRVEYTFIADASSSAFLVIGTNLSAAGSTVSAYMWGAQFEVGATPTAYQKVVSTYDVTEAGVNDAYYLQFDGVDDFMVTPSIDFSGTDKMSVFAGMRKLSDAATGIVYELSASTDTNNGSFFLAAPRAGAVANYGSRSKGTIVADSTSDAGYPAPNTSVVTVIGDISGDVSYVRVNGIAPAPTVTDQGTGNYGAYPLYIGMRGGTSLPFNGHLYSLVVRGALSDAAQISAAESYVNSKTGAY